MFVRWITRSRKHTPRAVDPKWRQKRSRYSQRDGFRWRRYKPVGDTHIAAILVRTRRNGKTVRQEHIAYLGGIQASVLQRCKAFLAEDEQAKMVSFHVVPDITLPPLLILHQFWQRAAKALTDAGITDDTEVQRVISALKKRVPYFDGTPLFSQPGAIEQAEHYTKWMTDVWGPVDDNVDRTKPHEIMPKEIRWR
jgi:hypothetical protein